MVVKGYHLLLLIGGLILFSCGKKEEKVKTSSEIIGSYKHSKKASYISIPPGIVSIFLDESKKGNAELKDLLSDVNNLTFLIIPKPKGTDKVCGYYYELSSRLDSIHFCDLAQINSGKELVRVKADGDSQQFNELVFLVSNYDALYCVSFKGDISPKKVAQLVKPENIHAVTNLDRFK